MEKIRNFVENLFLGLPDSPEIGQAKAHLIEGMCDRYEELLAQGKNEAEALGTVVGEFGSMEELLQGLGISREPQSGPLPETPQFRPDFPQAEYEAFWRWYPIAVAAGVALCILASAVWMLLPRTVGNLRHVVFLVMIALAVGDFIYLGLRKDHYESPRAGADRDRDTRLSNLQGVIMLAATVTYLIIGFYGDLWHLGWVVFIVGAALCILVEVIWPGR